MEKIRNVIWDCDNVMWFHKKEETKILAETLKIKEIEELNAEFFSMINMFNTYFSKKRVTLKEYYKIIEEEMPILYFYDITPAYFLQIWGKMKFKVNEFNEDILVIMQYLREKNIKIIVKTDWWKDIQTGALKEYGILKYIEEMYCCDHSFLKSNPLSAQEIIVPGREEEYVIIGDSLSSDIAFANHSGIKSIWFNRDGKQNDTPYKPTCEITSLLEVMKII